MKPPRSLAKLGGSLLSLPNMRELVQWLLRERSSTRWVFTVGGGGVVDQVRVWDRVHQLGEEAAHWLALEGIGLNELLLLRLFPEWRLVRSLSQLELAEQEGCVPLICSSCFFRWGERQAEIQGGERRLPHTWETCSDSLAWWFAELIAAEELVLFKSVDWPRGKSWSAAVEEGLVDREFLRLVSDQIAVRWVNGRSASPRIVNCNE